MFSFVEGQTVKATRDLRAGWGLSRTVIHRGTRGIVVGKAGLFGSSYRVSFPQGYVGNVPGRHLKPTLMSPGNDFHVGVRIGMAVFTIGLPSLGCARYLLAGGTISGLITALPWALIDMALGLASFGIHHLSSASFLIIGMVWVLRIWRRRRA